MALFIVFNDGSDRRYHVPQRPSHDGLRFDRIAYVQADGHELERIRATMTNLPMSTAQVVRWYGDDARFIYGNF